MEKFDYGILIKLLNKAADAYYNSGTPIMSDAEYDIKMDELREFEEKTGIIFSNSPTQKVGASVLSSLKKVQIIPKPMLSLGKCHSDVEVAEFANNQNMIAMVKLDGLSVRVKYNNGKLISANTRGNGVEGTDITEHIKQFQNIPLTIPYDKEYIIDGEAIIKISDFEAINQNGDFKNPRNAASGALNVLDTKLVKDRRLSFIAWDVIYGYSSDFNYLSDKLEEAKAFGFETVPYVLYPDCGKTINDVNKEFISLNNEYPCDGVVWKYNNFIYGQAQGSTSHHFKDAIAWKPEVEIAESRLKYIDWTMGRTGVLTPVAVFEPVELDGSVIERASLHNYSIMRKTLGPCAYVGEPVKIIKANMIIPQIIEAGPFYNYGEVIAAGGISAHDEPECCPICGHPLELKTSDDGVENYFCSNPNCSGKAVNILDHFCGKKGLDIKGLSKATLEKLISWEWVSNFSDIYELEKHKNEWMNKQGFGDKSVRAVLAAIEDSKAQTLESFISAIGIPLIGRNVAKEICKHVSSYEEFRKLVDDNYDFSNWDTFGPEKCIAIRKYDFTEADKVAKYLTFAQSEAEEATNSLYGITVVITGKLNHYKNRAALQKEIENRGGKVSSSISGNTSYLINNDINSTSAKNKSAKAVGIPIISEQEFIEKFLH